MSIRADQTERSPLLPPGSQTADSAVVESQSQVADDAESPIAEEPSSGKLLLILGSIWVGVFLSALGKQPCVILET